MQAAAVPKAAWMAAVAVGLVLAGGVVSSLAQASEPLLSGLRSGYKPSEDWLTAGAGSQFRAVTHVPVTVVLGPAVRLRAWVSTGQVAAPATSPPAGLDDPANRSDGGRYGVTPSASVLVRLAAPLLAGQRLQLSVFANTPWVLFARATSGLEPTDLVLVEVQHGPGRELPHPEEGHLVPQATLAPGGAGMLLARSDRVGVTSLLYLVQPRTEGQEGEAGPVQLRFDLLSVSR